MSPSVPFTITGSRREGRVQVLTIRVPRRVRWQLATYAWAFGWPPPLVAEARRRRARGE